MSRLLFVCVIVMVAIAFLLFFPIILENSLHVDINQKKVGVSIRLYGLVELLGGYVAAYPGGVAIHRKENKATIIPYAQMEKERKRFSFTRLFRVISGSLTTETGAEYLLPIEIVQAVFRMISLWLGGETTKIKNSIWLTDGDILKISLHVVSYFNGFMLMRAFMNFIKEKIDLWMRKNKKSAV